MDVFSYNKVGYIYIFLTIFFLIATESGIAWEGF